jgi:transcriptional regulator with XRE-family HTH domain
MGKQFGIYLKKLRLDRKMSLREVEKIAKISNAYLSQVERGERNIPTLKILSRVAKAYGVEVGELIKRAEEEFENKGQKENEISNPDSEYISRGYEGLSDEGKKILKEYLQYIMEKERSKWNKS